MQVNSKSLKKCITPFLVVILLIAIVVPFHGITIYQRWSELHSGRILFRGSTSGKNIALTFDDGPDPRYTPKVLDILKAQHVKATFFVCGRMLEANPALGRRIVAEGHILGNHTETHPDLDKERYVNVSQELGLCENRIESICGERTYLFRPPKGLWNPNVFNAARRQGYTIVLWSLAFDRQAIKNSAKLRMRVQSLVHPNDIILMHDGSVHNTEDRQATTRELSALITDLKAKGYNFVTIPELLRVRGDSPMSSRRVVN